MDAILSLYLPHYTMHVRGVQFTFDYYNIDLNQQVCAHFI